MILLCLSSLFFSVDACQVNEQVIEEFQRWHNPQFPSEDFSKPLPKLMTLYPGMSRATQIIPEKTRDYLIAQFKKFSLSDKEWAERWRQVESQLLSHNHDAYGALKVLESLGREVFEELRVRKQLLFEDLPELKGALSARLFLMNGNQREELFGQILKDHLGVKDGRDELVLKLIGQESFALRLSESQKKDLSLFLLGVHDQFKARGDFLKVKKIFEENLVEFKESFREELGFPMPPPSRVFGILVKMKRDLIKR